MSQIKRRRPRHTNPTQPRVREKNRCVIETSATAPYNFIPLPHQIALIDKSPDQDTYKENGLTGYIECKITTESPTYIRGMLDIDHYRWLQNNEILDNPHEKEKLAKFFSTSEEKRDGLPLPSIPGSSLRGMLRNLVEVISYSRIHAVAKDPQIWFREVGRGGAMDNSYVKAIGAYGKKVCAGFLSQEGNRWYVEPALLPQEADPSLCDKTYCKVSESVIQTNKKYLPGFRSLYEDGYKLQKIPYKIRFSVNMQQIRGQRENIVAHLAQYKGNENKYDQTGYLICTGNMVNTRQRPVPYNQRHRKYYPIVLAPNLDEESKRILIEEDAVRFYKQNLTDKIKEDLDSNGCLYEGNIVFYVPPAHPDGEIIYFGHNPYFRVPLRKNGKDVSPWNFIPKFPLLEGKVDYVEAIFGADLDADIGERDLETEIKGKNLGPAGRVSFMNAKIDLAASSDSIWYRQPPRPEAPKILASPKATAYAHYLVQDSCIGTDLGLGEAHDHNPDGDKKKLANYSTSTSETEIRGHKLYWAKGTDPDYWADKEDLQNREKTLTRVITLNKGIVFKVKIKFRNLREKELGALLWALKLPAESGIYRHRIGMGKSLGMGVIQIEPKLYITDKEEQYKRLFEISNQTMNWYTPCQIVDDIQQYLDCFEEDIKKQILPKHLQTKAIKLSGLKRIEDFLSLLSWQPKMDDRKMKAWREETKYMDLQAFSELAVLPSPEKVIDCADKRSKHDQSRHIH